jgi:hypothetical protein
MLTCTSEAREHQRDVLRGRPNTLVGPRLQRLQAAIALEAECVDARSCAAMTTAAALT